MDVDINCDGAVKPRITVMNFMANSSAVMDSDCRLYALFPAQPRCAPLR